MPGLRQNAGMAKRPTVKEMTKATKQATKRARAKGATQAERDRLRRMADAERKSKG